VAIALVLAAVACVAAPQLALAAPAAGNVLDTGSGHACAVKTNGTPVCWGGTGMMRYGQATLPAGIGPVSSITAGGSHTCAVETDGTPICWGANWSGEATVPADIGPVSSITAGGSYTCAVKTDGTPICWGANWSGQATVPADIGPVSSIDAGDAHTCAIKPDNTAVCWGSNQYGQATPPAGTVRMISTGRFHTCAVKTDGTPVCWGFSGNGQASVPAGIGPVSAISAGDYHSCAVKADGTVVCWGYDSPEVLIPPSGLGTVRSISAGGFFTCAVKTDHTPACWGENYDGGTNVPAGIGTVGSTAEDRYLAPTGDDTGGCTSQSAPCASLAYVQGELSAGDTVNLAAGDYTQGSQALQAANVTYKGPQAGVAAPGRSGPEARILVGPGSVGLYVMGSDITFDGLTFASQASSEQGAYAVYGTSPGVSLLNTAIDDLGTGLYLSQSAAVIGSDIDVSSDAISAVQGLTVTDSRLSAGEFGSGVTSSVGAATTITGTTFARGLYGVDVDHGAVVTVAGNRFSPQLGTALNNDGTPVVATNNWWGCNDGANATGCATTAGEATVEPHLVLNLAASPSTFTAPGSTTITADLLKNSNGDALSHGPIGNGIALSTDHGTLSNEHPPLVDGAATSTLTMNAASSPTVTATLDNETATASVEVTGVKPVNTTLPAITGNPRVGETLTADRGTWDNSPSRYRYAWQRCSGSPTVCTTINGETSETYTLTADDLGTRPRVVVVATNPAGSSSISSLRTAVIGAKPASTIRPTISGIAQVGQTLTTTHGTWENSPTSYTYRWQRCSGSPIVCTTVTDTPSHPTYTITTDDYATQLRAVAVAKNAFGSTAASSLATATVTEYICDC
jgi:hypothetical protein